MILLKAYAQKVDSLYIQAYGEKIRLTGFVADNELQLQQDGKSYVPNNRLALGVGLGIKNTIVNARFGYGVVPVRDSQYGDTKVIDIQTHQYGRRILVDFFFQEYKGFYHEKEDQPITLYPDMKVFQMGGEVTYLLKGNRFSARAAFEQSELQLKNAGSFLLGGGIYFNKIEPGTLQALVETEPIKNFQLGFNGGYAHSWVLSATWQATGMIKVGANFGNEPDLLEKWKIEVFPTAFGRCAAVYHKQTWALSFVALIQNRIVHSLQDNTLSLRSMNTQIAYVKHFGGNAQKR